MSIIAVGGIPFKRSLIRVMKLCAPAINGPFETLNFAPGINGKKICYMRLAPELDPFEVIKRINLIKTPTFAPYAFIPRNIPDLQLATKLRSFPSEPSKYVKKPILSSSQVLAYTHCGILTEMQTKYPGLYRLNNETEERGHPKLIYTIALEVYNRLLKIKMPKRPTLPTVFQVSREYRKHHPHIGDFPLILSTLNQLLDMEGKSCIELKESNLTAGTAKCILIDNVPYDKVVSAKKKYLHLITNKVLEHVNNIPSKMDIDNEMIEDARTRVREQVKKMTPYLSTMIQEIVHKSLIPQELYKIAIYGEPSLPVRGGMRSWLTQRGAHECGEPRDVSLFNLVHVRVARSRLQAFLACDGADVGRSKLVIRLVSNQICKVPITEFTENKDSAILW